MLNRKNKKIIKMENYADDDDDDGKMLMHAVHRKIRKKISPFVNHF